MSGKLGMRLTGYTCNQIIVLGKGKYTLDAKQHKAT